MADSSLASKSRRNILNPPKHQPPTAGRRTRPRSPIQQARRVGRALRSHSRETAGDEGPRDVVGASTRGVRQLSTESVGSGQGSDMKGRRRKGKGKALRSGIDIRDLSTVAEDPPVEYPNLERDVLHEVDRQDTEEAGVNALGDAGAAETDEDDPRGAAESPTAFSTISGTTARTSHSAQELADLDAELILEVLPTLSDTSSGLLGVLVPAGATTEEISDITKGLLLPGSKVSRRVKFRESSFQSARGEFGSDQYIDLSIIGRALLGVRLTKDIGTGPWSPDPLLQKANLAIFATRMLVHQRGSQDLWAAVALLDSKFPAPFLSTLEPLSGSVIGGSRLLRQTFDLALNLRTQLMLMILSQHVEKPNYDPDAILAYVFFEGRNNVKGWSVPGLGGGGSQLPAEFEKLVLERIQRIRQSFTEPSESLFVAGEPAETPAELKRLEETFPWIDFLSEVVSWTNLRLEEIERQVAEQGGTNAIVLALRGEINQRRNERSRDIENDEVGEEEGADEEEAGEERLIDLTFEPPAWKTHRSSDQESVTGVPTTEKAQKVPGLSFNSPAGVAYIKKREAARRSIQEQESPALYPSLSQTTDNQTTSVAGLSRQNQAAVSANRADVVTESRDEGDWRPYNEDEDDVGVPAVVTSSAPPPSSSAPAQMERYNRHQREKNKENVKLRETNEEAPKPKKSFIDPQVGAKRVDFSEDLEDSQPTSFQKPKAVDKGKKRARDAEEQMEEESGDDDFEIDSRPVKQARRKRLRTKPQADRIAAPIQHSLSPEHGQPSQSRQSRQRRTQNGIKLSQQQRSRNRRAETEEEALSSQFHDISDASSQDDDESEADASFKDINYQYINTLAKRSVAMKARKVQVRRAWTDQEVSRFIELVEKYGPSWARIEQAEDPLLAGRSQVNLKDKARNMKFDFVKAQQVIPVGFDTVRLNRNQLNMLDELGIEYDQ